MFLLAAIFYLAIQIDHVVGAVTENGNGKTPNYFCGNGLPRSALSQHFGKGICSERYYQCPQCINTDSGYKCRCGIGFNYRPKNSMCVATSLDSSLEFKRPKNQLDYPSYTLLIGTVIPTLTQFTISFRIQVTNSSLPGTVLSYTPQGRPLPAIEIISGPTFRLRLLETFYDTKIILTPFRWYHVVWTWSHASKNSFLNFFFELLKSAPP